MHYYIPSREEEGYGLSKTGVEFAHAIGADLLISCDCGINAFDEVEYANSKGVDVIITDHHSPEIQLPDAFAILNPKQIDCDYPFKGLCGAGVIFKLAWALAEKAGYDLTLVKQHVDLVALGIAADLVPIIDENRVIVHHGLELIEKQQQLLDQTTEQLSSSGAKAPQDYSDFMPLDKELLDQLGLDRIFGCQFP